MPKIIDCFPFFNEVELLEYRLELLWDIVDHFVISEGTVTFTGNNKPMYFDTDRYSKYMSKITYIKVDDYPETTDPWVRERFQRNALTRGLSQLSLRPDDIVLLSDVDEIPNPDTLRAVQMSGLSETKCLAQIMYYYNFETKTPQAWFHPKIFPYSVVMNGANLDNLRGSYCPVIPNGGWHCSYFGTPEFVQNKLKSFSHQEYNTEKYTDLNAIRKKIQDHSDLFGRSANPFHRVQYVPGSSDVPPNSERLLSLFKQPLQ